jgi:mandelate racemase
MTAFALTVRRLRSRAVMLPLRRPFVTGSGELKQVPLVLVDLETEEGVTGVAYLFSPSKYAIKPLVAMLDSVEALIVGRAVAPVALETMLRKQFLLLGGSGLVTMTIAAIDMAAWDAVGKAAATPLARLWGGEIKALPAYNSTGLGLTDAKRSALQAVELLEFGFKAVKLRLGYPTLAEDLAVTRAVRSAVGDDVHVVADFNQCLDTAEAVRRSCALDDEGLYWIEEPVRADNFEGCAEVARNVKTSVQLGENFWSVQDVQKAISSKACDLIMPDVMKIGGASAWLRSAGLADATDVPISSHLFPELSAHMLSVSPTAHYLEYVDWAEPVLQQPMKIVDGQGMAADRPGSGMEWNEEAIARYLI